MGTIRGIQRVEELSDLGLRVSCWGYIGICIYIYIYERRAWYNIGKSHGEKHGNRDEIVSFRACVTAPLLALSPKS